MARQKNKIFVGSVDRNTPETTEFPAAGAITPGQILEYASGEFTQYAEDGGDEAFLYIADRNVVDNVDVAYAADDTVSAYKPMSGELYNVRLAASQTIAFDDPLTPNGVGALRKAVVGTDEIVCYAGEALTSGSGVTPLILVKFK